MDTLVLYRLITSLFNFYSILVVVYCLLSWLPMGRGGLLDDLGGVLDAIVGPYLNFFRSFIPPFGGIDFSPVAAILALNLIESFIVRIIL